MTETPTRTRSTGQLAAAVAAALYLGSAWSHPQGWREQGVASFDAVWQTVNDTYYDPSFGGLDWEAVRADLRPRAERAGSADEQRAAIREMLARLGQSHFSLLSVAPAEDERRGEASVPFDVRVSLAGVLVTRLHAGADPAVRPGDAITHIAGQDVSALLTGIAPEDPRRSMWSWQRVMHLLSGPASTRVGLVVRGPDAGLREVVVTRTVAPGEDIRVGNLPPLRAHLEAVERRGPSGRRVGVIRFTVWMASLAEPLAAAIDRFRSFDGLIIDLRGNPGGLADMIRGVAGHVLDAPAVLGRMRMRGLDLEFRANPRRSTSDGRPVVPYAGPVAILVDELTASASECFAGGLQALGRARIFGTRTAGQALPASTLRLANGDVLLYAVGDFVTSTGRRLEGVGVVPDEEVPPTPGGLAAGFDAEAAAVAWIDGRPVTR